MYEANIKIQPIHLLNLNIHKLEFGNMTIMQRKDVCLRILSRRIERFVRVLK